jgi:hypothetical protein
MITISKRSVYEYFAANFGGYRILLCFSKHLIIGLILFIALTKTVKKKPWCLTFMLLLQQK